MFLPLFALASDDDFSTYLSQSRPAEELVETARRVLGGGIRVSNLNDKVIIYGTKKEREAALRLFKELDSPGKMYRVHVRAAGSGRAERDARAIEGQIGNKNIAIGKKKSSVLKGRSGGTVSIGDLSATVESENLDTSNNGGQTLVLSDGASGMLTSGVFPTAMNVKIRGQGKGGMHLELRQQDANAPSGHQALATEIDVKLGVWRNIGGVSQSNKSQNGELLGSSTSSSAHRQDVQVMVELDSSGD